MEHIHLIERACPGRAALADRSDDQGAGDAIAELPGDEQSKLLLLKRRSLRLQPLRS
jgi:hypothetical protein